MPRRHMDKLPAVLLTTATLFGGQTAVAAAAGDGLRIHPFKRESLSARVQSDINKLARRAGTDRKLGDTAVAIAREGKLAIFGAVESALTRDSAQQDGLYELGFVAPYSTKHGFDLSHVKKLELLEGQTNSTGQLENGTELIAEMSRQGALVAGVTAPSSAAGDHRTSEASAARHTRPHEQRLNIHWLRDWDRLAERIITGAEVKPLYWDGAHTVSGPTPTGPLPQAFPRRPGTIAYPF